MNRRTGKTYSLVRCAKHRARTTGRRTYIAVPDSVEAQRVRRMIGPDEPLVQVIVTEPGRRPEGVLPEDVRYDDHC